MRDAASVAVLVEWVMSGGMVLHLIDVAPDVRGCQRSCSYAIGLQPALWGEMDVVRMWVGPTRASPAAAAARHPPHEGGGSFGGLWLTWCASGSTTATSPPSAPCAPRPLRGGGTEIPPTLLGRAIGGIGEGALAERVRGWGTLTTHARRWP